MKLRSHTAMEHRPGELQQNTTEQQINRIAVCEVVPGQSRQHETSQARLRSFCIALELIMKGIHSKNPAAMKPKIHSTERLQWSSPSSPRILVWQSLSSWVECVPKQWVLVGSSCSGWYARGVPPYGVVASTELSSRASGNTA